MVLAGVADPAAKVSVTVGELPPATAVGATPLTV